MKRFLLVVLLASAAVPVHAQIRGVGGTNATSVISSCSATDTQVLFDDGGSCAGNAGLLFTKTGGILTVTGGAVRITGSTGGIANGFRVSNTALGAPDVNLYNTNASPISGVLSFGDGTGWEFHFRTTAGADVITIVDTGDLQVKRALQVGGTTALTLTSGAVGIVKIAASGSAPGASGLKLEVVCGTNAGSAKIVAAAGTSATVVTVLDNIGAGVTGC